MGVTMETAEKAEKCVTARHVSRTLLQAMSNPGTVHEVPEETLTDRGHTVLLAVAETVLDQEASFCVVGKDEEALERMVADLTCSPCTKAASAGCIPDACDGARTSRETEQRGATPDKGLTIIYLVAGFSGGPGSCSFLLKGPGITPVTSFSVEGLDRDELCALRDANKGFPLGIDCIFVDRVGKIACIPGSATIIDLHP